jgi:hypothetical protein
VKGGRAAPSLSSAVQAGVDALSGVDSLDVLEGPTWDAARERWMLRCRITVLPGTEPNIPPRTSWYVLIDVTYPAGRITIYPASVGGITHTFHHQNRNTVAPVGVAWRGGDICVHQGARALGRLGGSTEPLEAPLRLAWRLARAVAWVRAASVGALVGPGDPFELPDFAARFDGDVFAFCEDADSLQRWNAGAPVAGAAELYTAPGPLKRPTRTVVRVYRDMQGDPVYEPPWGKAFEPPRAEELTFGLWVRLPAVPHLDPWKTPETWGELVQCVAAAGIDLDDLVAAASGRFRTARQGWLLCGFPMPAQVGGANVEYFWQALRLPALSSSDAVLNGFRNTEKNRRFIDRLTRFRRGAPLNWVRSENWHPTTRSVRGRFSDALTRRRVLMVGCGALGSVLAELLVRGGLESLTVCDGETAMAGNLARHTLTLQDVGQNKAIALADRLNQASPHVRVEALRRPFPPVAQHDVALVRTAELIIDCTGEDDAAFAMAAFDWQQERAFWSVALDWQARRSFSFLTRGGRFPADSFLAAVREQLDADPATLARRELGREGVGCWHPVMPARIDHVWMLASAAIGQLDDALRTGGGLDQLVVLERDDTMMSAGVRRVR